MLAGRVGRPGRAPAWKIKNARRGGRAVQTGIIEPGGGERLAGGLRRGVLMVCRSPSPPSFNHGPRGLPCQEGGQRKGRPSERSLWPNVDPPSLNSVVNGQSPRTRLSMSPIDRRPTRHSPRHDRGQNQDRREPEAKPAAFGCRVQSVILIEALQNARAESQPLAVTRPIVRFGIQPQRGASQ